MTVFDPYDIDFIGFSHWVDKINFIGIGLAVILSEHLTNITNSYIDRIVMMLVNRNGDNYKMEDIKKLEDRTITLFNMEIKIGRIISTVIMWIIIPYIIFLMTVIIIKTSKILKNNDFIH